MIDILRTFPVLRLFRCFFMLSRRVSNQSLNKTRSGLIIIETGATVTMKNQKNATKAMKVEIPEKIVVFVFPRVRLSSREA